MRAAVPDLLNESGQSARSAHLREPVGSILRPQTNRFRPRAESCPAPNACSCRPFVQELVAYPLIGIRFVGRTASRFVPFLIEFTLRTGIMASTFQANYRSGRSATSSWWATRQPLVPAFPCTFTGLQRRTNVPTCQKSTGWPHPRDRSSSQVGISALNSRAEKVSGGVLYVNVFALRPKDKLITVCWDGRAVA